MKVPVIPTPKHSDAMVEYRIVLQGKVPLKDVLCLDDLDEPITNTRQLVELIQDEVGKPYSYAKNAYEFLCVEHEVDLTPIEIDLELIT